PRRRRRAGGQAGPARGHRRSRAVAPVALPPAPQEGAARPPRLTDDYARVTALLGREPQCGFEVVVRSADGDPVVIRNEPLLDDGTPMPTRYWLVGEAEVRAVSQLEAAGGVRRAAREVDPFE